jgi:two-component system nitrogen regulation response regulator NtrX
MAKILIIDDDENIRNSLKSALERRGHSVTTAENYKKGGELSSAGFDVIFLDVILPDGNGIDLLREILNNDGNQTVVMISGHADIDMAVKAIQTGAYDFIEKPISLDRVLITLENATRKNRLAFEKERMSMLLYGDLIGKSEKMKSLKNDIARSAPKASRFLILGENGTGKELVAHMIHRHSQRSDGPFITVNCAALPADLVESELFGHTAGAFTGATKGRKGRFLEADGGSIFLDEISEMSSAVQAKVLRVIESNEITPVGADKALAVKCNIIAASNKDLNGMIREGHFREDLFFRLNVVQFDIPLLRDRKDDIPLLADYFLRRFADETGGETKELTAEALKHLSNYSFPGNVRELKNIMERVNIYCEKSQVGIKDIMPLIPQGQERLTDNLKTASENFEKQYIELALSLADGNVAAAARRLGIERSHLYKKLKKYNIL